MADATLQRCPDCDRADCPWLPFDRMSYDEFDGFEPAVTGAAANDCRAHRVDWRARAIELQAELDKRGREANELEAQVERMKPLVDAAIAWSNEVYGERTSYELRFEAAVDAYRAQGGS